jgi:hypothetical protein
MRRVTTAAFVLVALLAWGWSMVSAQELTLTLPHPPAAGGVAWLQVRVGAIGRGQQIDVTTETGRRLGTISPFGVRSGEAAGTYTLPVPADAIHDGKLSVRVTISRAGTAPRTPTPEELRSVKLIVPGAGQ